MGSVSSIYAARETGLAIGVPGLVYRTEWAVHILFDDGLYRYDWPDQGLISDLAVDQRKNPSFWGRWESDGKRLAIAREGATFQFAVEGDAIVDGRGTRFARLPNQQDSVDLTGTWVRESSASATPRITFFSGDRFETRGGLMGLIASPEFVAHWGPYPPGSLFQWPDAAGRYGMESYTMALARDDGPILGMLALASPDRLRLGYTWFLRDG